MADTISVVEMFRSIQGETSLAGLPCCFVRTAGCNLACSYCDTVYAREEAGRELSVEQVAAEVGALGSGPVCVTGGEPLLHPAVPRLCERLLELDRLVLVETNGTLDVSSLPAGLVRVVDVKCPGSGECGSTLWSNLEHLNERDQVKFVLCDRRDFDWAVGCVQERRLAERCEVLFAPAWGRLAGRELAEWILDSGVEARLQIQLHRILWPDRKRGV